MAASMRPSQYLPAPTDGGGAPHARRRSQAADGVAVFEDDACAEEGNAADHLRGDAGRVRAPQSVGADGRIHKGIFGQYHEQGGGAGDDAVGADARLLLPLAALQAHQGAQARRQQQTDQKLQIIVQCQGAFRQIAAQSCQHSHSS